MHLTAMLALTAGTATMAIAQNRPDRTPSPVSTMLALASTNVLQLSTNNQQQQIEIEVLPGEVRVYGISGIPSGTSFTGVDAIELTTGNAQDYVEFRIFAADVPPILLNTRGGNSDVKVIYFTPQGTAVTSDVQILGGSGNDKAAFEVYNEADAFSATWSVTQGNGDNEATANIDSSRFTSLIDVDFASVAGLGQDKAELHIISAAARLNAAFTPRTGDGNDSALLTIDGIEPGTASLFIDTNLGAGQDVSEAVAVWRGGAAAISGRMLGGNGDDQLKLLLEGSGSTAVVMNGGAGNDTLDAEYKGAVTGAPQFLGGDGNDYLKIVADTPSLLSPTLNGGAGFDEGVGFGRFISVEKIN